MSDQPSLVTETVLPVCAGAATMVIKAAITTASNVPILPSWSMLSFDTRLFGGLSPGRISASRREKVSVNCPPLRSLYCQTSSLGDMRGELHFPVHSFRLSLKTDP